MRLAQILETLTRTPLLMTPPAVESYLTMFEQHMNMSVEDFHAAREGVDWCGDPVALEQMTIEGSLAMIPIRGPLGIGLGKFEKGAGATDYQDIIDDINAAAENPKVEKAIGVFDTPGGMWGGLPEAADAILRFRDAGKDFYAFVPAGGSMASAGMYLGAACSGRFISPSAQVGSIGVYCAYTDMSERAKAMGIKVKVFSSGKYKGMGVPGTSLTAAQEEYLQNNVISLAGEFYDHIRGHLGDIPDEAMQGQMFRASEAKRLRLVDDEVADLATLKSFLQ